MRLTMLYSVRNIVPASMALDHGAQVFIYLGHGDAAVSHGC